MGCIYKVIRVFLSSMYNPAQHAVGNFTEVQNRFFIHKLKLEFNRLFFLFEGLD